jgi:GGDEF domain-containing protein
MRWGLWDSHSFDANSKRWHVLLGGYCGFVLLVVLLSCVNALTWRDPIHLYYAAYVVMLGVAQLSLSGMAGEFLWPGWAWWNDMAAVVLPLWAAAMLGPLVVELIAERGQKWISRAVGACAVAGLALSFAFLLLGRGPVFLLSNIYYAVIFVFYFGVLAWFARRRPRVGLWILAGFTVVFVGSTFAVLRNLTVLPMSFATQYGSQIGVALEIPLLLVGLYFRSRERRDSQVRLSALSRVDPLTGVGSHRVLMERLEHLVERSRRDRTLGAVLRVRLANGAEIRQEHGTEVWQAAQVKAGTIMARAAVEGDTVARHQDGDFVILLEGRLTREQVADTARSIVARGLAYSKNLPPTVTLSFHVACAHAPLPPEAEAQRLLDMLAAQLAEIQRNPARALRFLGDVGSMVFSGPGEPVA